MIEHPLSWWGIKNSGQDITSEILRIINDADSFVIVGGYNFTFSSSSGARPFFDALKGKSLSGVQVLLIFPPMLHGSYNPQPKIIHHCITNNLPVILNHQNHSKWLLTDKDLYYGSSNFTNASWLNRVEVVSIHEHTKLAKKWSRDTIGDFKIFLDNEIANLNSPGRRMKHYRGLLTSTRTSWKSIKTLVHKFNPSINKVIITLNKYDNIISILNKQVVFWFDHYSEKEFELIFDLSSKMSISVDQLCEYAYANIYNETVKSDITEIDQSKINGYNTLYQKLLTEIDGCVERLPDESEDFVMKSELGDFNLNRINSLKQKLDNIIK